MLITNPTVSLAFSLSLIALAPLVWAAAPVAKFPILPRMANQSTLGVSPADGTKKYYAEAFCTPSQRFTERMAWRDALQYALALASWQQNGSFQPAMDLYMGNQSRGELGATLRSTASGTRKGNGHLILSPANCERSSQYRGRSESPRSINLAREAKTLCLLHRA